MRPHKDEIGEMAEAVQVFKENAIRVQELESQSAAQKRQAKLDRPAAMNQLADAFEASVGWVIERVAAPVAELQSASGQMARPPPRPSRPGHQSGLVTSSANAAIRSLVDAAGRRRIGDVTGLITKVASQTSLARLERHHQGGLRWRSRQGLRGGGGRGEDSRQPETAKVTEEIAGQIAAVQGGTSAVVQGRSRPPCRCPASGDRAFAPGRVPAHRGDALPRSGAQRRCRAPADGLEFGDRDRPAYRGSTTTTAASST